MQNAKDKAIRYRVCQFIAGIMGELKEDMDINDELWEELQTVLLARTKDKIATVRGMAARAMVRLQVCFSDSPRRRGEDDRGEGTGGVWSEETVGRGELNRDSQAK